MGEKAGCLLGGSFEPPKGGGGSGKGARVAEQLLPPKILVSKVLQEISPTYVQSKMRSAKLESF